MLTWRVYAGALAIIAFGWGCLAIGKDLKQAEWDRATLLQQKADTAAEKETSHDVAQAKAESVKVITQVKTITRTVPVYRDAQCQHDDRVFDDLNRALRGSGDGDVPVGSGGAPGQVYGRDNGQAD